MRHRTETRRPSTSGDVRRRGVRRPSFARLLAAPVAALLSGCTLIGAEVGTSLDGALFREDVEALGLTEAEVGRPIELTTLSGRRVEGRFGGPVLSSSREPSLVVYQGESQSLFRTVPAFEDTIPVAAVDTVVLGGKQGVLATIGGLAGLATDIALFPALINEIRNAFAGLR